MNTNFSFVYGSELGKLIPTSDLGWVRPFYIEVENKLVACKFVRWFYPYVQRADIYAEIELANGMHIFSAELFFESGYYKNAFKVYNASDDVLIGSVKYYYDKHHKKIKLDVFEYSADDWLPLIMQSLPYSKVGDNNKFVGWCWNGIEAVGATIAVKGLQYTFNGLCVEDIRYVLDGKFVDNDKIYATKEECEKDNTIDIVDFDDNDDEDDDEETHTITMTFNMKEKDLKSLYSSFNALENINIISVNID